MSLREYNNWARSKPLIYSMRMSAAQDLTKKLGNWLERFPHLWLLAIKAHGFRKFDPDRPTYTKPLRLATSELNAQQLDVLFDAQCIQTPTRQRGIGKYTINFITAMAEAFPEKQFGAYFTNITSTENLLEVKALIEDRSPSNLTVYIFDAFGSRDKPSVTNAISSISEQIQILNPKALVTMSSFEKATNAVPTPVNHFAIKLAILYDLIPLQYPKVLLASRKQKTFYQWILDRQKHFDLILAISEASQHAWLNLVGGSPKIEVIYGGPSTSLKPSLGLPLDQRQGVLVVGAEQPHKNLPFVIQAYGKLPKDIQARNPLTIVGIRSAGFRKRLEALAKKNDTKVSIPNYISVENLEALYRSNRILVMPSLFEGLSLPILEAWNQGLVAIGSQNTVASELIVNPDNLFDPLDETSLLKKVLNLLSNDLDWHLAQTELIVRRKQFTWSQVTINSFNFILKGEFN